MVQLAEQEEKWKTKVKQVLHISLEKLAGAEEKLQHQMEEKIKTEGECGKYEGKAGNFSEN